MAQNVSKTTTDHETIRRWAEERGGWPAQAASTEQGGQAGIVRIDFPGYTGEGKLERISWDDWFRKFDESSLAFVYEETAAGGQRSSFNKLVKRETAQARAARPEGAAMPAQAKAAKAPETGEAGRKTRPRAAGKAKRAGGARRGAGRRQTSRAAAARTAGRGARRGMRGARKPKAKGMPRATTRGGRRGGGRSSRRSR